MEAGQAADLILANRESQEFNKGLGSCHVVLRIHESTGV